MFRDHAGFLRAHETAAVALPSRCPCHAETRSGESPPCVWQSQRSPSVSRCGLCVGCAELEATRFYRSGTDALDRGEAQRAVADLERAADLAPEVSAIQNHLGIAYEEAGRSDDALRAYERAVALDCDNRAAESNLRELRARSDEPRATANGAAHEHGSGAPAVSGRDDDDRGERPKLSWSELDKRRGKARQAASERRPAGRCGGGARSGGDAVLSEEARPAALLEGRQTRDGGATGSASPSATRSEHPASTTLAACISRRSGRRRKPH